MPEGKSVGWPEYMEWAADEGSKLLDAIEEGWQEVFAEMRPNHDTTRADYYAGLIEWIGHVSANMTKTLTRRAMYEEMSGKEWRP